MESDIKPEVDLKNPDEFELGWDETTEASWELEDMSDGCWAEIRKGNDSVTDEDLEEFEKAFEEEWFSGVEELGWSNDDTEYVFVGPLILTNEDTGEEWKGEEE